MIRSLHAVPVMVCLATALVTAQAPAGDRPAGRYPAAEQPREQEPRRTTPPPSAQQPTRPAETSTMAAKKVTYTGCLKPGTAAGTWILENAEVAQRAGAASTPSRVGTSGTARMSFNLEPAETINLKPHANHKVEVVGTLAPAPPRADAAHSMHDAAQSTRDAARSTRDAARSTRDAARATRDAERATRDAARSTRDAERSSAAGARSSTAGAATSDAHASARQQLTVESLKMVSGTCP